MKRARVLAWMLTVTVPLLGGHGGCAPAAPVVQLPPEPVLPTSTSNRPLVSPSFDIGAVMRQVHFAFRPVGDAFVSDDVAHRVDVRAGVWSLRGSVTDGSTGLVVETQQITRGGEALALTPVSTDVGETGELHIERGIVAEHLRNEASGVEQSWSWPARPVGHGDVAVQIRVSGADYVTTTEGGIHFADRASRGYRYGHATWIDATGRRTRVASRWIGGETVEIRVPGDVVDASVFPAVLDPTVGMEFGIDNPVIRPAGGSQANPAIACDGTNYLVAWEDTRLGGVDILGARVTPAGTVLDRTGISISTAPGDQLAPSIAVLGANFVIAWSDARGGAPDIYAARVSGAGVVLDPPGIAVSVAAGNQTDPALECDGTNCLVVWTDLRSGATGDIYAARVAATGVVLDPAGVVVSAAAQDQSAPSIAYDGTNYVVVWQDQRSILGRDIYASRVSRAGIALDAAGVVVSAAAGSQSNPSIAFGGGTFLIAWTDARTGLNDIYASRFTSAGATVDAAGIAVSTAAGSQSNPVIVFATVNFQVLWQDARGATSDIYAARVTPTGMLLEPAGVAISTAAGNQTAPAVATDPVNAFAVWTDLRDGAVPDIYGSRVSRTIIVLDPMGVAVSTSAHVERAPSIAFDGTNYLVVWEDQRGATGVDVFGARVTAAGTVLDTAGIVVSAAAGDQLAPAAGFDGTNYLVAWQDARAGATFDIYGARVSRMGAVVDLPGIAINTAAGNQTQPAMAFDGTNYFIAWTDFRAGAASDIYGTRLDRTGIVLDGAGRVISAAANAQSSPALAFDGTNYLAAWTDGRAFATTDVYAARVSTGGAVLDAAGVAVSAAAGSQAAPTVSCDPTNCVVAWQDGRSGASDDIYAARVSRAGALLDAAGVAVATGGQNQRAPASAFDGTDHMLVWQDDRSGNTDLYAVRFGRAGTLTDPSPFVVSSDGSNESPPALASNAAGVSVVVYDRYDATVMFGSQRVRARTISSGLANGAACMMPAQCATGFCVDGLCCNAACGGGVATDCQACSVTAGASSNGTCGPVAAGTVCRPIAGDCDLAERCDGTALACPANALRMAGEVCRAAANTCDPAESCSGMTAMCPADMAAADGTMCDDMNGCTRTDRCAMGRCVGSNAVTCAALDECHMPGTCDTMTGACSDPPQLDGAPCTGGVCLGGMCSRGGDAGTTDASNDAGAVDAARDASTDAATADGDSGPAADTSSGRDVAGDAGRPMMPGGCGCRVIGRGPAESGGRNGFSGVALALAFAHAARRRRATTPTASERIATTFRR